MADLRKVADSHLKVWTDILQYDCGKGLPLGGIFGKFDERLQGVYKAIETAVDNGMLDSKEMEEFIGYLEETRTKMRNQIAKAKGEKALPN